MSLSIASISPRSGVEPDDTRGCGVYDEEGDCRPCETIGLFIALAIFGPLFDIVTCCDCCKGGMAFPCCNYQYLPICQDPLLPTDDIDALLALNKPPQEKLQLAQEKLAQLEKLLATRRKTHWWVSKLLCLGTCTPQTIKAVLAVVGETDDDDIPTWCSKQPPPKTELDLLWQFTNPCLKVEEWMGRPGMDQFLSPPEKQQMLDLDHKIFAMQKEKPQT